MPQVILKAEKDRDLYVLWSTIVEDMCFAGTRQEMARRLQCEGSSLGHSPEERLQRADETGTSARWYSPPFYGAWEDTGFIVQQTGWLRRDRLAGYADALLAGDERAAYSLLEPFEDSEPWEFEERLTRLLGEPW